MQPTIYLEWSYTPANYFEESLHENRENYRLEIDLGKIKAFLKKKESEMDFFNKIHDEVENYFKAVQIVTHKKYDLSRYTLYKQYSDGRRDVTVFPEPAQFRIFTGSADVKITKADGTVILDTKRERVEEEKLLAELFVKFRSQDKTVQKIMKSYSSAVNDSANELIHLYEIRDSLSDRFDSEKIVQRELGISAIEWSDFGRLSNNEPVREGRHRGKDLGTLRNATIDELTRARKLAKKLILEYLRLLDKGGIKPAI
jgi:hypothetical protein